MFKIASMHQRDAPGNGVANLYFMNVIRDVRFRMNICIDANPHFLSAKVRNQLALH